METTHLLSAEEFEDCFAHPMQNVTTNAAAEVDIWPYVDRLDLTSLGLSGVTDVQHVYRDAGNRFDQILIGTSKVDTLLVVVVDLERSSIAGHHILDLNDKYGIREDKIR